MRIASCFEAFAKQSYYDVLGVSKDADDRTIKKAIKREALTWRRPQDQRVTSRP